MFNSLKGKNLARISGQRKPMKFVPAKSGRDGALPSSDEGDLIAISNAIRRGFPIYLLRTSDGTTLDVLLDKPRAIRTCDVVRNRMGNGGPGVYLYERLATNLIRIH